VYKDEQLVPGMVLRLRKYYKKNEAIARVKLAPSPAEASSVKSFTPQPPPKHQKPRVVEKKPVISPGSQPPAKEKPEYREHLVIPGDTLYSISRYYGVTVNELRVWNNIGEDNLLSVGQKLEIRK
jgi:membrane-bound lytic murein transglycosylase D